MLRLRLRLRLRKCNESNVSTGGPVSAGDGEEDDSSFFIFSSPYDWLPVLGIHLLFSSLSCVLDQYLVMIFHVCNQIARQAGDPANAGNPTLIAVLVAVVGIWDTAVVGIWDTAATAGGGFWQVLAVALGTLVLAVFLVLPMLLLLVVGIVHRELFDVAADAPHFFFVLFFSHFQVLEPVVRLLLIPESYFANPSSVFC